MNKVVVLDVGGTKIAATVIDEDGNDLLGTNRLVIPTPARTTTEAFVDALSRQIEELVSQFDDVVGWGAAFPGPYKRADNGQLIVLPRNIPAMREVNAEALLNERFPALVGLVDNDLKLALWGEHLVGNAVGFDNVIGFVHSTGVSTAHIRNGELLRGSNNNAGEMGCVVVERDPALARPCDAQNGLAFGHLEGQIRGPVLAEIFFGVDRNDAIAVRGALESATASQLDELIQYTVPYVADVLAPICQVTEASRIVMHGSISKLLGDRYCTRLSEELAICSESFAANGSVVMAKNPEQAPLIGTANLVFAKAT